MTFASDGWGVMDFYIFIYSVAKLTVSPKAFGSELNCSTSPNQIVIKKYVPRITKTLCHVRENIWTGSLFTKRCTSISGFKAKLKSLLKATQLSNHWVCILLALLCIQIFVLSVCLTYTCCWHGRFGWCVYICIMCPALCSLVSAVLALRMFLIVTCQRTADEN